MINFEEAEKNALGKIGADCVILTEQIIEKPYGWYFSFQSKKYLKTENFSDTIVGSGGFIVEKEDGKIIEFSSAYPLEKNFEIYEAGFLNTNYDLVISQVKDVNQAVRMLHKLRMSYVESEFAHGVEWKIAKRFNEKQIKSALSDLPHTFQNQNFSFSFEEFEKINDSNCLHYELRKHQ